MLNRNVIAMCAGFVLDALLGDPKGWPHPVRLIGAQITFEERVIDRFVMTPKAKEGLQDNVDTWPLGTQATERLLGAALAADVALLAPVATWGLLKLCNRVHPWLAVAAQSALCYQLLAVRSLKDESMAVYNALDQGDLDGARKSCAMIVGRDTAGLDEEGLVRAAVETVAENTSDGVVAPLLFMAVGGAPAAMLYKAVNTLDSMVGYKNDRYRDRGFVAAKLDDVLNFIPARIAGALMCAAAPIAGLDGTRAWSVFKRDRLNHPSPNSAHTEAACAGALGVQLGGASTYGGVKAAKPTIGDPARPLVREDIRRAHKLMWATSALALGASVSLGLLLRRRG